MVRVEPVTQAWADALVQGDDVFAMRFGVPVEANWAGFPEVIPFLGDAAQGSGPPEWGTHLVFDDDGALVGNGGWKGAPSEGVAEVGYAVAPARQGRGIATAVVRVLVARARAAGLRKVIAHTLAETSPSTSVLLRCGFVKVDELVDVEDGPIWRWEISLLGD
ncbi:MAG: GNAT family N-acetyltransferase [Actinomycetota bacterium]|nr:GNAT family N-acetyltransferase [Actinomycetota bacterium]